ncbi:MAG: ketoacyl-ACP synthase III [Chloroflexi bacterium]|nr:ketoacyl-ACP synthase III [Chloroflexota bacterium]
MERFARIAGWGRYLPAQVVANRDLEGRLDTSDEWIFSRTGIRERRIAAPEETASSMGLAAARGALAMAGVHPQELDLIIVATCSAERVFPACASLIQHGLGARTVGAFDVNAACSGFVYALSAGHQFIASGLHRTVLVVGSEVFSRLLDWDDRATCVLFGDGAGAVVLQASEEPGGIRSCVLGSDGSGADALYVPGICASPLEAQRNGHHFLAMNGPQVFKFAVRTVAEATRQAAWQAGILPEEIDLFIPHQANARIISAAAEALGLSQEKVFTNVERYGNTSAASIPIALSEAAEAGRLRDGDRVALVGVGGGLSWAAMVLEWGPGAPSYNPE